MRNPLPALAFTTSLQMRAAAQSLPFHPTTILLPPASARDRNVAYAFQTSEETPTFVSLNISATISSDKLVLETLAPHPPFWSNSSHAFVPSISAQGEISVYTGSCSSAALWRFTPDNTSSIGNGTWAQQTTAPSSDITDTTLAGANFLSSAFDFSTLTNANASQTRIYVFGGMCPSDAATDPTWQSAASYSNLMLRLSPAASPSAPTTYALELPASRGPPIEEAGFTLTGLMPTVSNASGVETQSQSFVLVGGHTQTAFLNMSRLALWSLPEESWSFVTVASPGAGNANTELAIKRTVPGVDSRSGHTAVLTEDGTRLVVFGGWVGNVTQPAEPQLVVLHLGQGFGGSGDWQWTVPDAQPSGGAMYGHGAVMLPGNVMMVLGGYDISTAGSSKRQASSGARAQFFNATSMTWASSYTNPSYGAAMASDPARAPPATDSSSSATKIGLGAGLGLGLAAVLGATMVFFCYNGRHKRKAQEEREKRLQEMSMGASDVYEPPHREMSQHGAWTAVRWNGSTDNEGSQGNSYTYSSASEGYANVHDGVHGFGDVSRVPPLAKQIQRKPVRSRTTLGVYQPAPNFDLSNNSNHVRTNSLGTAGPIHPIYEADEDDSTYHDVAGIGIAIGDPNYKPNPAEANRFSDPFKDPPPASFSAAPAPTGRPEVESPAQSREREIQEWITDWAAAEALLTSQARSHSNAGRISPTRRAQLINATSVRSSVPGEEDSRTGSNLSDGTEGSLPPSTVSISRSGSSSQGRSRSNSLRGFITGIYPFASTGAASSVSPTSDTHMVLPVPHSAGPGSGSASSTSFSTAHTSFPLLQAEGEGLLPRPSGDESLASEDTSSGSGSPSKSKPSAALLGKGSRAGWLGSLRRVFIHPGAEEERSPRDLAFRDALPSPIRVDTSPRRTVSASAALWRRKQGKGDWEDSASPTKTNSRSNTLRDSSSRGCGRQGRVPVRGEKVDEEEEDEDEEDWDVERAVQNRVVQVMFTVPKEKLRVVNCEEGDLGDGASSVGGSLRSRRSGRGKMLGAGAGAAALAEPTKEEEEDGEASLLGSDGERKKGAETQAEKGKGKGKHKEMDLGDGDSSSSSSTRETRSTPMVRLLPCPSPCASPVLPSVRRAQSRGKVLGLVEEIERHSSPERAITPDRAATPGLGV